MIDSLRRFWLLLLLPGTLGAATLMTTTPTRTRTPTPTPPQTPTHTPTPPLQVLSIAPSSGPDPGGFAVTVAGTGFFPNTALTIGGVTAQITVVYWNEIDATVPALQPGTLNSITATNPAAGRPGAFRPLSSASLLPGFFADFTDVPQGDSFHSAVESIFRAGITAGCGGGLYCRDGSIRRDRMAVFLLKAEHGAAYTPPSCQGLFTDTPCPGPFTDWVEQLFAEGLTGGCGDGTFCPDSPVRRDQMAAFLLKAKHGSNYLPPPCHGAFADVACPSPFGDWIDQIALEGITAGCGGGKYCPEQNNTRGQMAVFIAKTFDLP